MRDFIERGGFVSPMHRDLALEAAEYLADPLPESPVSPAQPETTGPATSVWSGAGNGRQPAPHAISADTNREP